MFKKLMGWLKSVASEQDGSGSTSRTIALLCALTAILAFAYSVYTTHALPSRDQMLGLGVLLTAGHVPYAFNQISGGGQ